QASPAQTHADRRHHHWLCIGRGPRGGVDDVNARMVGPGQVDYGSAVINLGEVPADVHVCSCAIADYPVRHRTSVLELPDVCPQRTSSLANPTSVLNASPAARHLLRVYPRLTDDNTYARDAAANVRNRIAPCQVELASINPNAFKSPCVGGLDLLYVEPSLVGGVTGRLVNLLLQQIAGEVKVVRVRSTRRLARPNSIPSHRPDVRAEEMNLAEFPINAGAERRNRVAVSQQQPAGKHVAYVQTSYVGVLAILQNERRGCV